jgi:hypothetical protein
MNDIRGMLNSDQARVRAEFAKHIEKITMEPSGEHYVAQELGIWWAVAVSMVPGDRIAPRVHYPFSLPLAA